MEGLPPELGCAGRFELLVGVGTLLLLVFGGVESGLGLLALPLLYPLLDNGEVQLLFDDAAIFGLDSALTMVGGPINVAPLKQASLAGLLPLDKDC